jgi:hypothetical protein
VRTAMTSPSYICTSSMRKSSTQAVETNDDITKQIPCANDCGLGSGIVGNIIEIAEVNHD